MFTNPEPYLVESDAGFSVRLIVVRFPGGEVVYKEHDRTMHIFVEILASPDMELDVSSMKRWSAPHVGDPLSNEKKAEIIVNVQAAFRFINTPLRLRDDDGKVELLVLRLRERQRQDKRTKPDPS